jgi:hypothetical protein
VQQAVFDFLMAQPGATNHEIRAHLRQRGYPRITKKELNRLLYGLAPQRLRWDELPDGGRGWWVVEIGEGGPHDPEQVLVLSTDGAWAKR